MLYEAPAHHYTAALLASAVEPDPEAPRTSVPLIGEPPSPINPPSGCRFRTRCPRAEARCAEEVPEMREIGARPPGGLPLPDRELSIRPQRGAARARPRLAATLIALVGTPGALVLALPAAPSGAGTPVLPASVRAFGTPALGDLSAAAPNLPVVAVASTADGAGYWLVASDGGVFSYGDAAFHGSTGGLTLAQPIVGMAGTRPRAATGSWRPTAASSRSAHRSTGPRAASPSTSRSSEWRRRRTAAATGSWRPTVASSASATPPSTARPAACVLNAPVVGMAATPDGGGYWLVASDGGIFSFGDAAFHGSTGSLVLNAPVVGMAATGDGAGYWLVALDGGVFNFGDAPFDGSALSAADAPAVGIAAAGTAPGSGYRVAYGGLPAPFGPAVAGYLAQRADNVSMTVYDAANGVTWEVNPGQVQVTASIVKVDVMADALAADQRSGGIPPQQAALMPPMIEVSDNNAATSMWGIIGGAAGLGAFDRVLGLASTTPWPGPITDTNLGWAYTTTSADDMVKVVRTFAFANPVLSDPYRAYGLSLMHNIRADQVWGVPAGAPPGSVAVKTGFITPGPGDAQVNSIGYVDGAGAITCSRS